VNAISFAFTTYNVDVIEFVGPAGSKQSKGRFRARCRETGIELVGINAEHDISHALTLAGWPDAPVLFWRGSTPSLSHPSIYGMGRNRIELGDNFPRRVRRKVARPEISSESVAGSPRNRESKAAGREPFSSDQRNYAREATP
jgi:hypothetical protein